MTLEEAWTAWVRKGRLPDPRDAVAWRRAYAAFEAGWQAGLEQARSPQQLVEDMAEIEEDDGAG